MRKLIICIILILATMPFLIQTGFAEIGASERLNKCIAALRAENRTFEGPNGDIKISDEQIVAAIKELVQAKIDLEDSKIKGEINQVEHESFTSDLNRKEAEIIKATGLAKFTSLYEKLQSELIQSHNINESISQNKNRERRADEHKKLSTFTFHKMVSTVKVPTSLDFTKDSQKILIGLSDAINVLTTSDTSILMSRSYLGKKINGAHFHPIENTIVSGFDINKVAIIDASTAIILATLTGHTALVTEARFSPDGEFILSSSYDKTLRFWHASSGNLVHELIGHTDKVTHAAFSPDGKRAVSVSADRHIIIWDLAMGRPTHNFIGHDKAIYSVNFNHDGTRIITSSYDNTAKVWDASTMQLIHTFTKEKAITWAAFSADGDNIVIGSVDTKITLIDPISFREKITLTGPNGMIKSVIFSPDGNFIATSSLDNKVFIWRRVYAEVQP
jgi:WD40 repeat protein